MKRARWLIGIVAVLGVAFVVGACSGVGGGEQEAGAAQRAEDSAVGSAGGKMGEGVVVEEGALASPAPAEAPPVDLAGAEEIEVIPLPELGPKVIQTAAMTIAVPKGDFDETVDRARTIVAGLGGFVTASNASQGPDERLVRGSLVVRVPQTSYAQAMSQLSKLGKVQARNESGQDVSQQYVDLEARERHLEAVERQLLGFLEQTTTVGDALVVQDRLNQVQLQLEEVRGQLRYLDDQTSYSTITLNVSEHGVPVAAGGGGWGIADAWQAAIDGFMKVIGGVLVGLATAGPILAALALAFLGGRALVRRRRSGEPDAGGSAPTATPQA